MAAQCRTHGEWCAILCGRPAASKELAHQVAAPAEARGGHTRMEGACTALHGSSLCVLGLLRSAISTSDAAHPPADGVHSQCGQGLLRAQVHRRRARSTRCCVDSPHAVASRIMRLEASPRREPSSGHSTRHCACLASVASMAFPVCETWTVGRLGCHAPPSQACSECVAACSAS